MNESNASLLKGKAFKLIDNGQLAEALAYFDQACEADDNDAEAWFMSGSIYGNTGNTEEAIYRLRKAIDLKDNYVEAYMNLGSLLRSTGDVEGALENLEKAVAIEPAYSEAQIRLGVLLAESGKIEEARRSFQQALKNQSDNNDFYYRLIAIYRQLHFYSDASECLQSLVWLHPSIPEIHNDLGGALLFQGKTKPAIESFSRAIELNPDYDRAYSNLLLSKNYITDNNFQVLFQEHCDWAQKFCSSIKASDEHENTPDPGRCLKIGYVSPDLRNHPVAHFLEPVLKYHNINDFEVYCYSDTSQPDATSKRLRSFVDIWKDVSGTDDASLLKTIVSDKIDILVDLAGHCGNTRLSVFANKPAPVQVSYLGYPNTTGLSAIDYRIADPWTDVPEKAEDLYTESLVYLENGFLAYMPPEDSLPVITAPALENEYITFGSFNNLAKVTPEVIKHWAQLLDSVPNARLLIKEKALNDNNICNEVRNRFFEHGIHPERIQLTGWTPTIVEHLTTYNRVDIALDTFPYNGTTTTCEALWMGVPVITLAGKAHAGRVGLSILSQVGLTNLIAESGDQYITIAKELASEIEQLSGMRGTLRQLLMDSSICDCKARTADIESAYRTMWKKWCKIAG